MTFLIDGYNLLHAVGWASVGMPAGGLKAARRKLLDWLADARSSPARFDARVVFDGQPGRGGDESHRGVGSQFARGQTADDLIEAILAGERGRGVVAVSNDARVREAGRRAGGDGWDCDKFLDWLIATEKATPPAAKAVEEEKAPLPPQADADLLAAFRQPKPKPKR